jgi:hypothetical protein
MSTRRKPVNRSKEQRSERVRQSERVAPSIDLAAAVHALVADVPEDEWKRLPPNLAARVDELLYDRDK